MKKQTKMLSLSLASLVFLAMTGCGITNTTSEPAKTTGASSTTTTQTQQLQTVTIADDKGVSEAGVFLAQELGYFKDAGIDVKYQTFSSGADELTNLAASKADVGFTILNTGFYNAVAAGTGLKIVADSGRNTPGKSYFTLVTKKGSNIKDYADLKGKTIAIVSKGSINQLMLDQALAKGGLTEKDVKITVVDGFGDMMPLLQNGGADAAMDLEPLITVGIDKGILERFQDATDYSPNEQISVMMYSEQFQKNKDLAQKFMTAYIKGVRAYNDAFINGDKNRDQVTKILTQHTTTTDPKMLQEMYPVELDPNGAVDMNSIESEADWYLQNNYIKSKTPATQYVDDSYAKQAVQQLGAYQK